MLRTSQQALHSESREMAAVSSPFIFKCPHKPRGSHDALMLCHIYYLVVSVGWDPRHHSALSSAQGLTGPQSRCWLGLGSPWGLGASPAVMWLLAKGISSQPWTSGRLAPPARRGVGLLGVSAFPVPSPDPLLKGPLRISSFG